MQSGIHDFDELLHLVSKSSSKTYNMEKLYPLLRRARLELHWDLKLQLTMRSIAADDLIRLTKGELDKHSVFFKAILYGAYKNTGA